MLFLMEQHRYNLKETAYYTRFNCLTTCDTNSAIIGFRNYRTQCQITPLIYQDYISTPIAK